MNKETNSGRDWEKRFDKSKLFARVDAELRGYIKTFFTAELNRVREEAKREERREHFDTAMGLSKALVEHNHEKDLAQARLDTLREIEKLVEDVDQGVYGEAHDGLNLLKQKLEELK